MNQIRLLRSISACSSRKTPGSERRGFVERADIIQNRRGRTVLVVYETLETRRFYEGGNVGEIEGKKGAVSAARKAERKLLHPVSCAVFAAVFQKNLCTALWNC